MLFAEGTTVTATVSCRSAPPWSVPPRRRSSHDVSTRVFLQPLAIAYTRRNGMPVTRRDRPFLAWYGDMELGPHLSGFFLGGPVDAVVTWGEPIAFNGNRKEATAAAEAAVRLARFQKTSRFAGCA